jgi:hypothetical protein
MATSGPTTGAPPAAAASKDSWPEVVGVSSEEAKKKIKEGKPEADAFVNMDFNSGRVCWVFVDSNDKGCQSSQGWLGHDT